MTWHAAEARGTAITTALAKQLLQEQGAHDARLSLAGLADDYSLSSGPQPRQIEGRTLNTTVERLGLDCWSSSPSPAAGPLAAAGDHGSGGW
jgi:hypothetical protein